MRFEEAVRTVLGKYATFEGRAGRPEFWYWFAFVIGLQIVIGMAGQILPGMTMLGYLVSLVLLLPGIAVSVRRMHDVGKPGLIVLLGLIPIVGLYVLYLAVQPSAPANAYGAGPATAAATA